MLENVGEVKAELFGRWQTEDYIPPAVVDVSHIHCSFYRITTVYYWLLYYINTPCEQLHNKVCGIICSYCRNWMQLLESLNTCLCGVPTCFCIFPRCPTQACLYFYDKICHLSCTIIIRHNSRHTSLCVVLNHFSTFPYCFALACLYSHAVYCCSRGVYLLSFLLQGIVPRNEYGNVELFKPSMLPAGACHIQGNSH